MGQSLPLGFSLRKQKKEVRKIALGKVRKIPLSEIGRKEVGRTPKGFSHREKRSRKQSREKKQEAEKKSKKQTKVKQSKADNPFKILP